MAESSRWQWLRRLREQLSGRNAPAATPPSGPEPEPPSPATDSRAAGHPDDLRLVGNDRWNDGGKLSLDPHLRVALSLLELGDPVQVFERTGIRLPARDAADKAELQLPVHIELADAPTDEEAKRLSRMGLTIPRAYVDEAGRNAALRCVTATLAISRTGSRIDSDELQNRLRLLVNDKQILRLALAAPMSPCALAPVETHADFGLPADRSITIAGQDLQADGNGVVIGIIDDGCAFAHWNFLHADGTSRVLAIWDQGRKAPAGSWQPPPNFDYGCELVNVAIGGNPPPLDAALAKHTDDRGRIDEDAVYNEVDFRPYATLDGRAFNPSTHGAHVMDIAAGDARALFGRTGVAPAADLVFVQLPPDLVAEGGVVLSKYVQEGAQYIFDFAEQRAQQLGIAVPAVVNISYGGHYGPHDGTSLPETAFETMLALPDRAIVIAAGNGFAERCHTEGIVTAVRPASRHWEIPAFDQSMNVVEFWYTGPPELQLFITPPGATQRLGPVVAGDLPFDLVVANGAPVGRVDHVSNHPGNGDHQIMIALNATFDGQTPLAPPRPGGLPPVALAPSGTWLIELVRTTDRQAEPISCLDRTRPKPSSRNHASAAIAVRRRRSRSMLHDRRFRHRPFDNRRRRLQHRHLRNGRVLGLRADTSLIAVPGSPLEARGLCARSGGCARSRCTECSGTLRAVDAHGRHEHIRTSCRWTRRAGAAGEPRSRPSANAGCRPARASPCRREVGREPSRHAAPAGKPASGSGPSPTEKAALPFHLEQAHRQRARERLGDAQAARIAEGTGNGHGQVFPHSLVAWTNSHRSAESGALARSCEIFGERRAELLAGYIVRDIVQPGHHAVVGDSRSECPELVLQVVLPPGLSIVASPTS